MEMNAESAKRGMPQDTGVYSHVPPGAPKGDDKEFWGVEYEPTLHKWLGPFVMQVRCGPCALRLPLQATRPSVVHAAIFCVFAPRHAPRHACCCYAMYVL